MAGRAKVMFDEVIWVRIQYDDDKSEAVLKGKDVEDEETGASAQEHEFAVGDPCLAQYKNLGLYDAKILMVSDEKEKCMRASRATAADVSSHKKKEKAKDNSKKAQDKSDKVQDKMKKKDKKNDKTKDDGNPKSKKASKKLDSKRKSDAGETDQNDNDTLPFLLPPKKRGKASKTARPEEVAQKSAYEDILGCSSVFPTMSNNDPTYTKASANVPTSITQQQPIRNLTPISTTSTEASNVPTSTTLTQQPIHNATIFTQQPIQNLTPISTTSTHASNVPTSTTFAQDSPIQKAMLYTQQPPMQNSTIFTQQQNIPNTTIFTQQNIQNAMNSAQQQNMPIRTILPQTNRENSMTFTQQQHIPVPTTFTQTHIPSPMTFTQQQNISNTTTFPEQNAQNPMTFTQLLDASTHKDTPNDTFNLRQSYTSSMRVLDGNSSVTEEQGATFITPDEGGQNEELGFEVPVPCTSTPVKCTDCYWRRECERLLKERPVPPPAVVEWLQTLVPVDSPVSWNSNASSMDPPAPAGQSRLISGEDVFVSTKSLQQVKQEARSTKQLLRKMVPLLFTDVELAKSCGLGMRKSKFSAPGAKPLDNEKVSLLKAYATSYSKTMNWDSLSAKDMNKVFLDVVCQARMNLNLQPGIKKGKKQK